MLGIELAEVLSFLEIAKKIEGKIRSFQVDSREIGPRDLFFALPGKKTEGHNYLKQVAEQGGLAAVVHTSYQGPNYGLVLLFVPDVLKSLQELAKYFLQKFPVKVLAITGSLGKTTTKEFLYTLLKGKYRVEATPRNYNSEIGVPIALLNREKELDYYIVEMAMTQKKQIAFLVEVAPPYLALITTVTYVHSANFEGGLSEIAQAKVEIFSSSSTQIRILPKPFLLNLSAYTFSFTDKTADFFLRRKQSQVEITEKKGKKKVLSLPFQEEVFIYNFLAAYAAARCLGVEIEEIEKQIPLLITPPQRFQKIYVKDLVLIDDTYNATYESVKQGLLHIPTPKNPGRKIAVLAEMRELGKWREPLHKQVGEVALTVNLDYLFLLGDLCLPIQKIFEAKQKPVYFFREKQTLIQELLALVRPPDVIWVKGSRVWCMEQVVQAIHRSWENR